MFSYRDKNGGIFLNGDDELLSTVNDVDGTEPVFYGLKDNFLNKYYAQNINNRGEEGISCTLCTPKTDIDVTIPAIGTYMVSNALVAVAIGEYLGMTAESMAEGVESYKTVGSRDGVIKTEYITIIDDCYNANPISIKGGVDNLGNFKGRKIAVLGDMKELGKNSRQLHYEVGEYVKNSSTDVLVAVGKDAADIADGGKGGNTEVYYFETVDEALKQLSDIVRKNDNILVKASRAMKLENVVEYLKTL